MTAEEIENRGMRFSGYYNYIPQYYYDCVSQTSYLTIAGNCHNNNSEIYCVIHGDSNYGTRTSSFAYLTVKGKLHLVTA